MTKTNLKIRVMVMVLSVIVLGLSDQTAMAMFDEGREGEGSKKDWVANDRIIVKLKQEARLEHLEQELKYPPNNILPMDFVEETKELFSLGNLTSLQVKQRLQNIVSEKRGIQIAEENLPTLERWYVLKLSKEAIHSASEGEKGTFYLLELCNQLRTLPSVEMAIPSVKFKTSLVPDDPYFDPNKRSWRQSYPDLWGLYKMKASEAWDISTDSSDIVVAVSDTGVDYEHEDLYRNNIWINSPEDINKSGKFEPFPASSEGDLDSIDNDGNGVVDDVVGYDYTGVSGDPDPFDWNGHGTHVAGTIGAVANNGIGIPGVAWQVKIMVVQGLSEKGDGSMETLSQTIIYATLNKADVINMSWGGPFGPDSPLVQPLADAIKLAYWAGVHLVAAAGNDFGSESSLITPAGFREVMAISASTPNDTIANFSNHGLNIDVAAPGGDDMVTGSSQHAAILSSLSNKGECVLGKQYPERIIGSDYLRLGGTSMSAPHVSGLSALILSKHPELQPEEVRQILRSSSDDIVDAGWDIQSGYGRINAHQALMDSNSKPCLARIFSPLPYTGIDLKTNISITGFADGYNFQKYVLEYGKGIKPTVWQTIIESNNPVSGPSPGVLGVIDFSKHSLSSSEKYSIRLRVMDTTGKEFQDRTLFTTTPSAQLGYPVSIESSFNGGWVGVADIDSNGTQDVIIADAIGQNGPPTRIEARDFKGEKVAIFPVDATSILGIEPGGAAIGEIDLNSPGLEIVTVTGKTTEGWSIHLYTADGKEIMDTQAGWPKVIGFGFKSFFSTPMVKDIDLDGKMEIAQIIEQDDESRVYAFRRDGTSPFAGGYVSTVSGEKNTSSLAIGNVDTDPQLELVILGLNMADIGGATNLYKKLTVYEHNGSFAGNLAFEEDEFVGNEGILLADMNKDGIDEILYYSHLSDLNGVFEQKIHCLKWVDKEELLGWPVSFGPSPDGSYYPSAGDIDGDGDIEVVAPSGDKVWLIRKDGSLYPGWTTQTIPLLGPTVLLADLDGDGLSEIVAYTFFGDNAVYCWRLNGQPYEGFPMFHKSSLLFIVPPAIGDLDGDGDLELIIYEHWQGKIHVYDLPKPGSYPYRVEWGQFAGNAGRTGAYHPRHKISGQVKVVQYPKPVGRQTEAKFQLRELDRGEIMEMPLVTSPDGKFLLDNIPAGRYQMQAKVFNTLSALSNPKIIDLSQGDAQNVLFELRSGDAEGDNDVDFFDYTILTNCYGFNVIEKTPGGERWFDRRADFNDDKKVSVLDWSMLKFNYQQQGWSSLVLKYSIRGNAFIQGRKNENPVEKRGLQDKVQFQLKRAEDTVTPREVMSLSDGKISITELPPGRYRVTAKTFNTLRAKSEPEIIDLSKGDADGIKFDLPAGDADNDNDVDTGDLNILLAAFGSNRDTPNSKYDMRVDFNDDGKIDGKDRVILESNLNQKGAPGLE